MTIRESDLKVGDKVTVTRTVEGETPTSWTGHVTDVTDGNGFGLRECDGGSSWYSSADTLLSAYGCVQTITRAA